MTANFAVANPNFAEIDYTVGKYVCEPFYDTYDKYYPSNHIIERIKKGIETGCFYPQLHCREHLNVNRWMRDLRAEKKDVVLAFQYKMIGIGASFAEDNLFGYMDAFNTDCTDCKRLETVIHEAASIFLETFGYRSQTFVASCFVWSEKLEESLRKEGIVGIQSGFWQLVPKGENQAYHLKRRLHFSGERNKNGQIYTLRNCSYEPAYFQDAENSAENCYQEVKRSFKKGKPAIINTHRFNYIASISSENAKNNLIGLKKLLTRLKKEFPEIEFISTPELVEIIRESYGK